MSFFPEGDTALVTDDEARSLKKWNQIWHDARGNQVTAYPEGTQPLPSDDEQRTLVKLVALGGVGGGGGEEPPADPVADFVADVTSGDAPLTVIFTNLSVGDFTTWAWDFGDGGTSTDANPVHEYTEPGTYTVELTASGPDNDTEEKIAYIEVTDEPLFLELDGDFVTEAGGSVSAMTDVTGNGRHTNTNSGNNPTLIAGALNGHDVVRFDGVNDYLRTPDLDWEGNPKTWIMVLKMNSTANSQRIIADILGGTNCRLNVGAFSAAGKFVLSSGTSVIGPLVTTADFLIITMRFLPATLRINGVEYTGTITPSSFRDLVLGCNYNAGAPITFAAFDLAALKIWMSGRSDAQILAAEAEFATKYAL